MNKKLKKIFKKSLNKEQQKMFKRYLENDKYTNQEELYNDFVSELDSLQLDIFNTFFSDKKIRTENVEEKEFYFSTEQIENSIPSVLKMKIFFFLQKGNQLIFDYTDRKGNRRDILADSIDPELEQPDFNNDVFTYIVDSDDMQLKKLYFKRMHDIREYKHSL